MSTFELCETVRPILSAMVDGEAGAGDVALAEAHLKECRACASHFAFLRLSQQVLARTPQVFPPTSLSERIAAATYARPTFLDRVRGALRPAPARYALATAFTVGIVAVFVSRLPQPVTVAEEALDGPAPAAPAAPAREVTPPVTAAVPPSAVTPSAPAAAVPSRPSSPSPAISGSQPLAAASVRSTSSAPAATRAAKPSATSAASVVARVNTAEAARVAASSRPGRVSVGKEKPAQPGAVAREGKSGDSRGSGSLAVAPPPAPRMADLVVGAPRVTLPESEPSVVSHAAPVRTPVAAAPASSTTPRIDPTGPDAIRSAPTFAAGTPATPGGSAAARTPVESAKPSAVERVDDEGGGLSLKNTGPRSISGVVARNSLRGGGAGRGGINTSFGVSDARAAGLPVVDAPGKF